MISQVKAQMRMEMANNKKNKVMMEMEEGTFASHQKVGFLGEIRNVTLSTMLRCSLQVVM
jgi:hypothetical protein